MIRNVKSLLLGAGLSLASPTYAQQAESSSPDLVLINGKVLTMDNRSSVVEALAVLDGKILATGSNASVKSIIGTRTRVLDLAGKTVVPGLIDTHAHFKAAGLSEYVVSMSRAKTVAEALDAIKTFAAKKKPGEWIVGGAWHPPSQLAEKRYLTKQEIDSVAPNNPVYLRTVGHFSMANGLALQMAGVDKGTPNPSGGSFEKDASGELTGVLVETAIDRVEKAVPPWSEDDEVRQFKIAEGVLNSFGITSVVEGATEARDIRTLQKIAVSGEATLRAGLMFRPEPPADMSAWEAIMSGNGASSGFGDDWLKFAGIKIFYDGGMTLKTALTRDVYPDSHDDYHGIAQQTPERLKQLVSICNRYNWRVGVHVVGDLRYRPSTRCVRGRGQGKVDPRPALHPHPCKLDQARTDGARPQAGSPHRFSERVHVGQGRDRRALPWASDCGPCRAHKTLIEKMGIDSLGAGTDFPVNPINPLLNMYIMVTRKDPNGNVYGASEAISREQALRLYTSAAAHYTFEEGRKGTLEPGKLADLVVLSADYLTVPEDQIKDIKADATIVGGKVVFQR